MNKYSLSILLFTILHTPTVCLAQTDSPYLTPEQVVKLANSTRQKVQNLTKNASKAELAGLNLSFNRIYAVRNKALGNQAPILSKDILDAKDTPQDIENKINAILQNNSKPEDFMHLMEPPVIDYEKEETDSEETLASENISTMQPQENNLEMSGTTKEIIVEEEDDTTKHIFRRKVFTKQ